MTMSQAYSSAGKTCRPSAFRGIGFTQTTAATAHSNKSAPVKVRAIQVRQR